MSRSGSNVDYFDIVSRFDDRGLQEAERKFAATTQRINRLQAMVGPAGASGASGDNDALVRQAIANGDRLVKQQEEAENRTVRLGKALIVAHAAARSLSIAAAAIDWQKAMGTGDIEKATKAMDELAKATRSMPIVGEAGTAIGHIINARKDLFPFASSVRDAFAHKVLGQMSDDEIAAQDEEQAKLKAQQDQTQKAIDFRRKTGEDATKLTQKLKDDAELEGKSPLRREAILADRRVSDFYAQSKDIALKDPKAAYSPERQEALQGLRDASRAAYAAAAADDEERVAKVLDSFFDNVEKGSERISDDLDEFFDKVDEGVERNARRAVDLRGNTEETNLRTAGKPGEAAVRRIERELTDSLNDAGADPDLRQAYIENANAQLGALVASPGNRVAGGISAFNVSQTDLGRGDPQEETNHHLVDLVNEAKKTNAKLSDLTATTS